MSDKPEDKKTVAEVVEEEMKLAPSELIGKRLMEYYNEGVDHCIEVVEQHKGFSAATDAVIESIVFRLIILKKKNNE